MYQQTLLGTILNISCLLKTPGLVESHLYFLNPSRSSPQEIKVQESNIHQVRLWQVGFFEGLWYSTCNYLLFSTTFISDCHTLPLVQRVDCIFNFV